MTGLSILQLDSEIQVEQFDFSEELLQGRACKFYLVVFGNTGSMRCKNTILKLCSNIKILIYYLPFQSVTYNSHREAKFL